MEKIIKEEEINILNLNMLRSQSVIYRIVDVMGTSKGTSRTEYVWDDESELQDNNTSIIKLENFEIGRYIRRIDPGMDSSDLLASNVFYDNSSSSVMLVAPSSTVNGATVNGLSAVWTMEEIQ